MSENWQKLGVVTARIADKLAPVTFMVPLHGSLALAVYSEALENGKKPEAIIADAVRAYMGDMS